MVPKFRGDSNDWLDDEDKAPTRNLSAHVKKNVAARAVGLPPEKANGTVSEVFRAFAVLNWILQPKAKKIFSVTTEEPES